MEELTMDSHRVLFLLLVLVLGVAGNSGCDDSSTATRGQPAGGPAKALTPEERALLDEIQQHEFHLLEPVNFRTLEAGDPVMVRTLSSNNSLWIRLYEAPKDPEAVFGVKSTGITDEGDPVTTYYLAAGGTVRIITDCRHDPFAGSKAFTVKTPKPFLIGYMGVNLPCPCGSGKTWLKCNPGQCRSATFVIVTDNFPKDKQLHWVPPPDPEETQRTWQYAAVGAKTSDSAAEPRWKETGSLNVKRRNHSLIALPDGKTLAIGGMTVERIQGSIVGRATNTCEFYDPKTESWTATGSMFHEYGNSAAVMLQSGEVLVIGRGEHPYAECELYDPRTGKWVATGSLIDPRSEPVAATLLSNGKVLVAGGWTGSKALASCEVYDPATGAWAQTGTMHHSRACHQVVRLSNGRVFAVAGDASRKSCELYDPKTGKWTMTAPLNAERQRFFATLLPNGRVFVAGGDIEHGGPDLIESEPVTSCEVFDSADEAWNDTGPLPVPRTTLDSTAGVFPNGNVILVGGCGSTGCHLYDVQTSTWKTLTPPSVPRSTHAAAVLSDGRLMVSGGHKGGPDNYEATLTSCELLPSAHHERSGKKDPAS